MCRTFRIKDDDFIYHVMGRSISDIPLFRDDKDKDKYLFYIKKYQKKFDFKVYAYCLMKTHAHILVDANGADISKFMHGINQSYAQYFNNRYDRHGHVFQDRFKSKVVGDENYLFTVSAYIHNNPTDIEGYENCPEEYKYSTFSVYLGLKEDLYGIVDEEFIMGIFNKNIKKAREKYYKFVMKCDDEYMKMQYEFKDEKGEYRSERSVLVRDFKAEEVMNFIEKYTDVDEKMLKWKYKRKAKESRALCVFLIRYYCDFTYKEICALIGRLTLSRVSELSNIGLKLIESNDRYKNILEDFIKEKAAV
ncbi:MAG: transposase [Bacillota bacterium]|nr:transposase [Bacillota bacterium]